MNKRTENQRILQRISELRHVHSKPKRHDEHKQPRRPNLMSPADWLISLASMVTGFRVFMLFLPRQSVYLVYVTVRVVCAWWRVTKVTWVLTCGALFRVRLANLFDYSWYWYIYSKCTYISIIYERDFVKMHLKLGRKSEIQLWLINHITMTCSEQSWSHVAIRSMCLIVITTIIRPWRRVRIRYHSQVNGGHYYRAPSKRRLLEVRCLS